jgi:hypothetical protein
VFDWLVEDKGEERDCCKTKLLLVRTTSRSNSWNLLTPMGPQVLKVLFFASFSARPEYLTILWIVKAGRPIEATAWNTALCAITAL